MKRVIVIALFLAFISCRDKVICPAFQSTYILDDSTREAYFSYVWQLDEDTRSQFLAQRSGINDKDSSAGVVAQPKTDYYAYAGEKVVPWRVQERTKYGIVKNVFPPVKRYRMRTAPMENVLAPEPLSNNLVASDFSDSLALDSSLVATLGQDSISKSKPTRSVAAKKEARFLYGYDPSDNFNVEQLYYNKYFAYKLIDERPEPAPKIIPTDSLSANSAADTVQSKEPFFKGLFKKKNKEETTDEGGIQSEEGAAEETDENGG